MKTGIELIAEERERQIAVEGWSREHDSKHTDGELSDAAACYVVAASAGARGVDASEEFTVSMVDGYNDYMISWPWDEEWWKPSSDPVRNLVKAGALIAAEIDRLQTDKHLKSLTPPPGAPGSNQ